MRLLRWAAIWYYRLGIAAMITVAPVVVVISDSLTTRGIAQIVTLIGYAVLVIEARRQRR